jgi:hypothetical protein
MVCAENLEPKKDRDMLLTRHLTGSGVRWASNGMLLTPYFSLSAFLGVSRENGMRMIEAFRTVCPAEGPLLAPIDDCQEVWSSRITVTTVDRSRGSDSIDQVNASVFRMNSVIVSPTPNLRRRPEVTEGRAVNSGLSPLTVGSVGGFAEIASIPFPAAARQNQAMGGARG